MALKIYSVSDVARYALASVDVDANDVSNLKLQKLCYYAQGVVSAMRGQRLFKERVVAWDHGPVVPEIYHAYKVNGSAPIPPVTDFDPAVFDGVDRQALDDVLEHYGQFAPWRLRNMTHEEQPWIDAYKALQGSEISVESMVAYFRPQIEEDYVKRIYGKVQERAV